MYSDYEAVRDSQSGQAITAYCTALAHELGLILEDVRWGCGLPRDHAHTPYNLCISILKPFPADSVFWLPYEAVHEYVTGTTKAAVEMRIRDELEGLCNLHEQMSLP